MAWACLGVLASTATAHASEDEDWGESGRSDESFDFAPPAAPTPTAAPAPAAPDGGQGWKWTLGAVVRSDQAAWVERWGDKPFAKARQSVDLDLQTRTGDWRGRASAHVAWDGAYRYRRDSYDAPTRAAYEHLVQVRDAWIARSLGPWELSTGRQVLVVGEGDGISPLDVVNPRDLREPGQADLVDIRIPVWMTRVGLFRGAHRFELAWIHEANFGLRTPPWGPFSPLPALLGDPARSGGVDLAPLLAGRQLDWSHDQPALSWAGQQALLRWQLRGEGIDLGVVAASVLDGQGAIDGLPVAAFVNPARKEIDLRLAHRRYELIGASFATTWGALLGKGELVWQRRRPLAIELAGTVPDLGIARSDAVEGLASLAWRGLANTTLALEASKALLLQRPAGLLFPVDASQWSLRALHTAWRERLELSALAMGFGATAQYGLLARAEASWLIRDGLRASVGYVHYRPGREFGPFAGLDRHDRVWLRLRGDVAWP